MLIELLQPDVAVLDCRLPGLGSVEVAQEIARRGLPVQVLALSAYDYDRYVGGMLAAGAASRSKCARRSGGCDISSNRTQNDLAI